MFLISYLITIIVLLLRVQVRGICENLPEEQFQALKDLYYSTNGLRWTYPFNSNPWRFTSATSYSTPCTDQWAGVICVCNYPSVLEIGPYGIGALRLNSYDMLGTLPSSIGNMTDLLSLYLNKNLLSGTIPNTIGSLTCLGTISLSNNYITGSIPRTIEYLRLLTDISLTSNYLTGSIPKAVGYFPNLYILFIGYNKFTGTIPFTTSLKAINSVNLNNNIFTGTIPSIIGSLTTFSCINLQSNLLNGTIPSSITNLPNLLGLYLNENEFTGSLPENLGNITSLQYINLANNQISGSIPLSIGKLKSIIGLEFSYNRLVGNIPPSIGNFTKIQSLFLDNNLFTGTISSDLFFNLISLQHLTLNNNRLVGFIPKSVGNLKSITSLYLYDNFLTGTIPESIGDLIKLEYLTLHFNFLEGKIPSTLYNLTSLIVLYLNDNELTGTIASEIGNLKDLVYFQINTNRLGGTVPSSLGLLRITTLLMNNNELTGNFFDIYSNPSAEGAYYLIELNIQFNQFTGPISFFNISFPNVEILNIQNNLFTGSISLDLYKFPYLTSIVGTSNCITGSLPQTICSLNKSLTSLVFDVAGGNTACSSNIALNSNKPSFIKGTFSSLGLSGQLPSCLFSLTNLETLHLSGNKLIGTIPELANEEQSALSSLILSNNMLVGTIPSSIQRHSFTELDLSSNRLQGTLINSFKISSNQAILGLAVNRLSGPLPQSLTNNALSLNNNISNGLNILSSNIFGCSQEDIPEFDESSNSYTCGSNDLNDAYYVLMSSIGVMLICVIALTVIPSKVNTSVYKLGYRIKKLASRLKQYESSNVLFIETRGYLLSIINLSTFAIFVTIVLSLVMLPVYVTLNALEIGSIVSYQYGFILSMAFLHSIGVVIFISIVLFIIISFAKGLISLLKILLSDYYVMDQGVIPHSDSILNDISVYILITTLHIVNLAVTICINYLYVLSILNSNSFNQKQYQALQFSIALFKVAWSRLYIPMATRKLRKFVTAPRALSSYYVMSVVNFILAPSIATVTANPSCFYYVLEKPNSISIDNSQSITNCGTLSSLNQPSPDVVCSTIVYTVFSSAYPTFHYSYACGTALLIAYIPVLVYTYIVNGFFIPAVRIVVSFFGLSTLSNALAKVGYLPDQVRGSYFLVDLLIHITVMMTFGLASPILGVEIGIAIFINVSVSLLFVSNVLRTIDSPPVNLLSSQNSPLTAVEHVTIDCKPSSSLLFLENVNIKDSWRSILVCVDMIIITVILFWSWLFFDMVADGRGWVSGLICSVVFLSSILLLVYGMNFILNRMLIRYPIWRENIKNGARKILWVTELYDSDILLNIRKQECFDVISVEPSRVIAGDGIEMRVV